MIYLTLEEILILHNLQIEKFGGSLGIRDIRLLESAIYRPHTTFGGVELYPDIFTKAAALAHSIIKNHAFIDGNKRSGIHAAITFLRINGEMAKYNHQQLFKLAIDISTDKITLEKIAEFFKNKNGK